jgi:hypothetical protein
VPELLDALDREECAAWAADGLAQVGTADELPTLRSYEGPARDAVRRAIRTIVARGDARDGALTLASTPAGALSLPDTPALREGGAGGSWRTEDGPGSADGPEASRAAGDPAPKGAMQAS